MFSDVRIRLEGRVERVERAVRLWEAAAKAMASGAWSSAELLEQLGRSDPRLEAAVAALAYWQEDAREARQLLERWSAARERVRLTAAKRLRRLGVQPPSAELPDLLAELRRQGSMLYQARLGWGGWLRAAPVALISMALCLALLVHPGFLVWALAGLISLAWLWARSTSVVLTQRTLALGPRAAPLDKILAVNVRKGLLTNRAKRSELIVTLSDRPAWRIASGGDPTDLVRALRSAGVRVWVEEALFLW